MVTETEHPRVFSDGDRVVVVFDGNSGRDPEDRILSRGDFNKLLHFSVSSKGRLTFAKKIKAYPRFEQRCRLDEKGDTIPNPQYQEERTRYGRGFGKFQMEDVLLEEPRIVHFCEVNSVWWERHCVTKVTIGGE